jgi:hypothetical protein
VQKILLAFLMLVLAWGPGLAQTLESAPSDTPRASAKSLKRSGSKKSTPHKNRKKSKKSAKRSKGKKKKGRTVGDDSDKKLGSEIDHKAVTLDLEGDKGI